MPEPEVTPTAPETTDEKVGRVLSGLEGLRTQVALLGDRVERVARDTPAQIETLTQRVATVEQRLSATSSLPGQQASGNPVPPSSTPLTSRTRELFVWLAIGLLGAIIAYHLLEDNDGKSVRPVSSPISATESGRGFQNAETTSIIRVTTSEVILIGPDRTVPVVDHVRSVEGVLITFKK